MLWYCLLVRMPTFSLWFVKQNRMSLNVCFVWPQVKNYYLIIIKILILQLYGKALR